MPQTVIGVSILLAGILAGTLTTTLTTTLTAAGAPAQASDFRRLVVFGDSLSDTGNTASAPYSNGPVWVERIADRLGVEVAPSERGGSNYAVGGARIVGPSGSFSLLDQAARFLAEEPDTARPDTLFIVYGGGNDLFAILDSGIGSGASAAEAGHAADMAADALAGIVRDLVEAGARTILVPNLPDLAHVPAVRQLGPSAPSAASLLTRRFNDRLARGLDRVDAAAGPGTAILRLDVHGLLERALADPAAVGMDGIDISTPCLDPNGHCADPDRHLFWDSIHPTSLGHDRLGEAALRELRVLPS
ncbi:MAG TPA: SGNH/GDSL hydrolase family protein [Arenibaculum sp.]|nr:SGNH/GDSL hydrolase family protein [Arenibaculum sp.]